MQIDGDSQEEYAVEIPPEDSEEMKDDCSGPAMPSFVGQGFQQLNTSQFGGDSRLYEALKFVLKNADEQLTKAFDSKLLTFILESEGNKNPINIAEMAADNTLLRFQGFADCDFIRQINLILHLWYAKGSFPVLYEKMQGFTDETQEQVNHLNSVGPVVHSLFDHLLNGNAPQLIKTAALDFIVGIGARGLLTMLGLRTTTGSQDEPWPTKQDLRNNFNKMHTQLTQTEEAQRLIQRKNPPSKLSVGARALSKHAHRSSEGFWGDCRGSEAIKNQNADKKAILILDQCVWINVHILPHSEIIIECRVEQGYGIRWTINGAFRGFLEPQMFDGHDKGWKH